MLSRSVRSSRLISARYIHSSRINSNAVVVSGTLLAKSIRNQVADKVIEYNAQHFNSYNKFTPSLTIIQVGSRPDSSAYVRSKLKAAQSSNISSHLIKLDENISQEALMEEIDRLNKDPKVNGLLIQLPLPKHIDETLVTNSVATEKDVDGLIVITLVN